MQPLLPRCLVPLLDRILLDILRLLLWLEHLQRALPCPEYRPLQVSSSKMTLNTLLALPCLKGRPLQVMYS
jgi:hypothetical protein